MFINFFVRIVFSILNFIFRSKINQKILRKSAENPLLTALQIPTKVEAFDVSCRTIQKRLNELGLHSRRPAKKPLISKKNVKARLAFANCYKNYAVDDRKKYFDWTNQNLMFNNDKK